MWNNVQLIYTVLSNVCNKMHDAGALNRLKAVNIADMHSGT